MLLDREQVDAVGLLDFATLHRGYVFDFHLTYFALASKLYSFRALAASVIGLPPVLSTSR